MTRSEIYAEMESEMLEAVLADASTEEVEAIQERHQQRIDALEEV